MIRRMLVALAVSLASGCSKTPPKILEIPEVGVTIELSDVWRPADPSGSENPFGFVSPRIEDAGPGRTRVAKQPRGGTEIAYVTGKFALPHITILGIPPRAGAKRTLEDCEKSGFERPFTTVSWKLSPSTLKFPGVESRATIADQQTTQGLDLRSEIVVIAKDGYCYILTGSTSPSLWDGQKALIEGVLGSVRPI